MNKFFLIIILVSLLILIIIIQSHYSECVEIIKKKNNKILNNLMALFNRQVRLKIFLKNHWQELIILLAVYLIFFNVNIPSGYDSFENNAYYYDSENSIRDLIHSGVARDVGWLWKIKGSDLVIQAHLKSLKYAFLTLGFLLLFNRYKKNQKYLKESVEEAKKFDKLDHLNIVPIESLIVNNFKNKLNNIEGFSSLILEGCYGEITPEIKKVIIKINESSEESIKAWIQIMEEIRRLKRVQNGSFRIIHFEDDKFLGEIYRKKLEEAGFVAKHLAQPDENVLESIKEFNPDLIITDILMPKLNGYQLIKKIREDEKFDNVPIIGLSNQSKEETLAKVLSLGGNDYWVSSEHTPKEIVKKIEIILKTKG